MKKTVFIYCLLSFFITANCCDDACIKALETGTKILHVGVSAVIAFAGMGIMIYKECFAVTDSNSKNQLHVGRLLTKDVKK